MIRLFPYCLPVIRRVSRPFRRVPRGTGVATVAKVTAGAVILGGRVCFDLLTWGGGAVPVAPPVVIAVPAVPAVPAGPAFGTDLARGSIFDQATPYLVASLPDRTVASAPVSVPEPWSVALFAVGLAGLAAVGFRRRA